MGLKIQKNKPPNTAKVDSQTLKKIRYMLLLE
jgi:hypothetical protein